MSAALADEEGAAKRDSVPLGSVGEPSVTGTAAEDEDASRRWRDTLRPVRDSFTYRRAASSSNNANRSSRCNFMAMAKR